MLWLALALIAAFLLLHPFTTFPLSLALMARLGGHRPLRPDPEGRRGPRPAVDIVFCAYNEAKVLEAKLANCLAVAARHPGVRVHVYSDGSGDGTAAILERVAAEVGPERLRAVVSTVRTGKSLGMNRLLEGATAPLTVFTDANVMLDVEGFATLYEVFADPDIGCLCGHLIYTNAAESTTAATGSLYWRLEEWIKAQETATGSVIGADGSLFAIRRRLFRPVPADIIDDFFTSLSILCDGHRVVRAEGFRAYERSVAGGGEEFRRKVRIACRAVNCWRLLHPRLARLPWLDRYKFWSHKILRWLGIVWLALAILFGLAWFAALGLLPLGLLLLLLAAAGLWLGRRLGFGPAGAIWDLLAAFAATGLGVWRSLQGERFRTWETAGSAR